MFRVRDGAKPGASVSVRLGLGQELGLWILLVLRLGLWLMLCLG